MEQRARVAALWLAPPALMVVIFALSSMPSDDVDRGVLYVVARKLAHFSEYALLTALWWRALRTLIPHGRALATAVGIAVAYAVTDEYHQSFVEGRVGTPTDVLIDTAGALTAAALIARRHRMVRV